MTALIVSAGDLPSSPVDAAAFFYSHVVPGIREDLADATEVVIHFEPADHSHRAWRLAVVQELAREAAPKRVNAIVGTDCKATLAAKQYLESAPGVTGQLLVVDGKSGEID
jgi:hypothetical protein